MAISKFFRNVAGRLMHVIACLADLPHRIHEWYIDHFVLHVTLCQSNEHIYIPRRMWHLIESDFRDELHDLRVFFKRYPMLTTTTAQYEYLMFVNPTDDVLTASDGQKAQTVPLQFNIFGHIGMQSVYPTPAEIVYEYGILCEFTDKVRLRVRRITYDGRPAYVLTPDLVGQPIHTPFNPD